MGGGESPLSLVSRFPNGAPIATSGRHVVAIFNKAVTPQDLIDKCDAVWYYNGQPYALHSYPNAQGTHSDRIILASTDDENDPYQISLDIEGNTLTWARDDDRYLFDFDFNHQNRKLFDANTGTYLLEMPVLSDSASYLPVVRVSNDPGAEEDEIGIAIYYSASGLDPICANPNDLEDIDVGEWFNGSYPDTQEGYNKFTAALILIKKVCELEYNWGERGVFRDQSDEITIDGGTLNLFTDGGQPITMVSRLSSGSPVMASSLTERGVVLCTFNRKVDVSELAGKTSIVIQQGARVETITASDGDSYVNFRGEFGTLLCKIEGRRLLASNLGDTANIYDIDFNNQHQRAADISEAYYLLAAPKMSGQDGYFPIINLAMSDDNIAALIYSARGLNNQTWLNDIELSTDTYGPWIGSIDNTVVADILKAILAMEYSNTSTVNISSTESGPSVDGGTFNMFND